MRARTADPFAGRPLWLPRLSAMTTSPGTSIRARQLSTQAIKASPLIGPSEKEGQATCTPGGASSAVRARIVRSGLSRPATPRHQTAAPTVPPSSKFRATRDLISIDIGNITLLPIICWNVTHETVPSGLHMPIQAGADRLQASRFSTLRALA
jgi:hypothetical protein